MSIVLFSPLEKFLKKKKTPPKKIITDNNESDKEKIVCRRVDLLESAYITELNVPITGIIVETYM